jgi:molybdenum storage protein
MGKKLGQSSKQTKGDYLASGALRHVESGFMKDSLLSEQTKRKSAASVYPLMPDVVAVQIGGKIIDGGRRTLLPVLDEIRANLADQKMIIASSSGRRAKHVLAVGEDLGLPTGILAELRRLDTELNAHMIGALLSPFGIAELTHAEMVHMLPAMLEISRGVVFNGVPPYDLWEHPPVSGLDPPTGADAGVLLFALTTGMKGVIYVRDVDGIFSEDPAVNPRASLIRKATAANLVHSGPKTSCIDREVVELLAASRTQITVSVVNGTKPGMLTQSLRGQTPGTLMTS